MMKLTTSKGKTYTVVYADGPTRMTGNVMIRMEDARPLLEIGAEFDRLEHLNVTDDNVPEKDWTGYTQLAALRRLNSTDVLIELAKP